MSTVQGKLVGDVFTPDSILIKTKTIAMKFLSLFLLIFP